MKLLFDQNLSPELAKLLGDLFPDSDHVDRLGMGMSADSDIAAYAKKHGFAVVTKDSDFLAHSGPPLSCKVVWVRLPNSTTKRVHELIRRVAIRIRHFGDDPGSNLLMVR